MIQIIFQILKSLQATKNAHKSEVADEDFSDDEQENDDD